MNYKYKCKACGLSFQTKMDHGCTSFATERGWDKVKDTMSKKEKDHIKLREAFDVWLGSEYEKESKSNPGNTNRWQFCFPWGHEKEVETYHQGGFDCACCLCDFKLEKCGCDCHKRVEQIIKFFEEYFKK